MRALDDCLNNRAETSLMTHEEEYSLCNNSLEKSLNKVMTSPQQVTVSNPGKKRESDFQNYHIAILKMSNFQFEELHGLSAIIRIGGEKRNRNHPQGNPGIVLTRQRL